MRLIPLVCGFLSFIVCQTAGAGQKTVTCYLDGARVQQDAEAANGYLEYALPEALVPGTLRVKPLSGGNILRVELVPAEQDRRRAREIARLEERKGELQDKMQALSRREEIFSAAAKSQSGKGLKKTKTNPDPLGSMQQGTDFALAQLDSVYRSQRKCRSALDLLERELAAARKGTPLARIWLTGSGARVSYLISNGRWTPSYDLRWSGNAAGELLLHARLPQLEKGVRYQVSNGTVSQGLPVRQVRGEFPTLSRYPLTLRGGAGSDRMPLAFTFAPVEAGLPPGEASVFWRGEYLGSGPFPGGGASEFSLAGK
jgi:hypothetical protein